MNLNNETLIIGVVALVVLVFLFILLRELICWYYKINETIKLQKETNQLLTKMLMRMPVPTPVTGTETTKSQNGASGIEVPVS